MPGSVTVHALDAGYLTLPEALFVTPLANQTARKTVPSLSFLIQHTDPQTSKATRIVFDLGIRKRVADYAPPIYKHAMTRQPLSGDPDTVASLAAGGLSPDDIDVIVLSHLHWDHIGTPEDYPHSSFVIGPGAGALVNGNKRQVKDESHSHFEEGLLDRSRTIELQKPDQFVSAENHETQYLEPPTRERATTLFSKAWNPIGPFPQGMDIFGDGSVYLISAPGHLDGHINLLCRRPDGKYLYLAGDACHDGRLLSGEKQIATWSDPEYPDTICCIHSDKATAEGTLERIREAMTGMTVSAPSSIW